MDWARNARTYHIAIIALVVIVSADNDATADAVIVTRAMQASTIAEISVEEKQVRVEIEVSANDLAEFANILPDVVYENVAGRTRLFAERIRTFIDKDWTIHADGKPLRGKLERIVPTERVVRDDVTGEALIDQPDDAEIVIRLLLHYELEKLPQTLTIRPGIGGGEATASSICCY